MNDIDEILEEAGERWRAAQPPPAPIDPQTLLRSGRRARLTIGLVAALTAVAVVLAYAYAAQQPGIWPDVAGQAPRAGSQPDAFESGGQDCNVTRPEPRFVPPSPYPASPLAIRQERATAEWFGADALWTMLNREGEVWQQSALPHGPNGLGQKTWWFSTEWPGTIAEPEPAITVVGERLDGPGEFTFGPGTNAGSADFGEAMLVGVEFPTPGCWRLTGHYRGAELSYVVWIKKE